MDTNFRFVLQQISKFIIKYVKNISTIKFTTVDQKFTISPTIIDKKFLQISICKLQIFACCKKALVQPDHQALYFGMWVL